MILCKTIYYKNIKIHKYQKIYILENIFTFHIIK